MTILYNRNDVDFKRGATGARGEVVDIYPYGKCDSGQVQGDELERLSSLDPLTGELGTSERFTCTAQYVTKTRSIKRLQPSVRSW